MDTKQNVNGQRIVSGSLTEKELDDLIQSNKAGIQKLKYIKGVDVAVLELAETLLFFIETLAAEIKRRNDKASS